MNAQIPAARLAAAVALAAAAVSTPACKHAPINGNADPVSVETARNGRSGDILKGELGPAAREALKYMPHGAAGGELPPGSRPGDLTKDEVAIPDRWRIGWPAWERGSQTDSPWDLGHPLDPYHQNVLKGDYPIPGTQNTFLILEAQSQTLLEFRNSPTPSGVFTRSPGNDEFFGNFHQRTQLSQLTLSADVFHGETSFKPVDWRVFVKGAANANYTKVQENFALYADPAKGETRYDDHVALQQAFFETTLASLNAKYDVIQARIGTQLFNSDFRGFIFYDEALGYRLFGTADDNRWQWNAGYFRRWRKDTNSGLNTFKSIEQDVVILNLYRQDVLEMLLPRWKSKNWSHGLTSQVSFHWFEDDPGVTYNENGFIVRPRPVGAVRPNETRSRYLGWANDGHVDWLNVNTALYHVFGEHEHNEIAGRQTDIDAWMAALELSRDYDWQRFRIQGFWASGDDDPRDGQAKGFDAIFDNPNFAGGEFGYWNRNGLPLVGSAVALVQGGSLLNSLRSSKIEGSQSFVNPGLKLLGVGYDAQLTPKLKIVANASHLWFDNVSSVEYVIGQADISKEIGWDLSLGAIYRPGLTENVILKGGVAALTPGQGFRDIYNSETLFTVFGEVILTW